MICLSFCLSLLTAVLGAVGTVISGQINGWAMFQSYTLLSNLLLLAACAVQAGYELRILRGRGLFVPSWARVLKYVAVCCTTLTFLTVAFVLVPAKGGWSAVPWYFLMGFGPYHHLLCPLLGLLTFVLLDAPDLPDRRVALLAVLPTACYAAVTAALNAAGLLDGPYFFLRVRHQPLAATLLWTAVLLLGDWGLALAIRKLASLRSEPREEAVSAAPGAFAWTEDGYLRDQDALRGYTYRAIPASNNGCGPAAAYNLRRAAGQDPDFREVLAEMERMHLLRVPGPTGTPVMRRYLQKYLPGFREVRGREEAVRAASESRMGIFRYTEEQVPHFVSYLALGDGVFRFFNVSDGLEDGALSMERFGREHFLDGKVILFCYG